MKHHLLDGGLAAAPEPHEQNPRLGAVSAPRATTSASPRPNPAARGCRLLFLLLHAVAEVLWERIRRAVTAGEGRLLRPVRCPAIFGAPEAIATGDALWASARIVLLLQLYSPKSTFIDACEVLGHKEHKTGIDTDPACFPVVRRLIDIGPLR